jgi:hypothetical protein
MTPSGPVAVLTAVLATCGSSSARVIVAGLRSALLIGAGVVVIGAALSLAISRQPRLPTTRAEPMTPLYPRDFALTR